MLRLRHFLRVSWKGVPNELRRMLFTDESLGLASFDVFRQKRRESLVISQDQLWKRLEESCDQIIAQDDSQTTKLVFSEDILQAIALAETHDDTNRIYQAVRPFVKQRSEGGAYRMLKLATKPFAPLLMRLFHRTRNADLAFHALTQTEDKAMEEFFRTDLQCYQIGMDLFFETRHYQRVLDTWEIYEKRTEGTLDSPSSRLPTFPRSLQVLVLAACYKINTRDSLQFAMAYIGKGYERHSRSISFTRKALALASALASNQSETELAFEILSLIGHNVVDSYTAPRSLKCILLVKLFRWPEVIQLLQRILESDLPSEAYQDREISIDAVKAIENGIESIEDMEMREKLKRCCILLRRGKHVVETSLDDLLCAPVQILPPTAEIPGHEFPAISSPAIAANRMISHATGSGSKNILAKNIEEQDEEKSIWETSAVYEDDSSAMASVEKFKESEMKMRRVQKRKQKILNSVGRWIREEGPLAVDDDRGGR